MPSALLPHTSSTKMNGLQTSDLNPLDYHVWGAMLERYRTHRPKPKDKAELKTVLEAIWTDLPQAPIDIAVLAFRKSLKACISEDGGHFEHRFSKASKIGPFQGHQIIQRESKRSVTETLFCNVKNSSRFNVWLISFFDFYKNFHNFSTH